MSYIHISPPAGWLPPVPMPTITTPATSVPGGHVWPWPPQSKKLTAPPYSDVHDGVMIALYPSPETAAKLALPGGTPAGELHITVAYLGKTSDVEPGPLIAAAQGAAALSGPVRGSLGGIARFTGGDEGDPLVALFDSAVLEDLRVLVRSALQAAGIELNREHGYTPHMTLGYLEPSGSSPVERMPAQELEFTSLAVVYGSERTGIDLTGNTDERPEMAPQTETKDAQPEGESQGQDEAALTPQDTGLADSAGQDGGDQEPPQSGEDTEVTGTEVTDTEGGASGGGEQDAAAGTETEAETKAGGPPVSTGAFVAVGNRRGRVDMIITSGMVPGARHPDSGEPVQGSPSAPAARVVEYKPTGSGTFTSSGEKFAALVSRLKRIAPLRSRSTKTLGEALGWALAEHAAEQLSVGETSLRAVYERGVKSWPGAAVTTLDAHAWGLGRVDAFVATAAGLRPAGYHGDDDLLPGAP